MNKIFNYQYYRPENCLEKQCRSRLDGPYEPPQLDLQR